MFYRVFIMLLVAVLAFMKNIITESSLKVCAAWNGTLLKQQFSVIELYCSETSLLKG
jgi:hypothetical protein